MSTKEEEMEELKENMAAVMLMMRKQAEKMQLQEETIEKLTYNLSKTSTSSSGTTTAILSQQEKEILLHDSTSIGRVHFLRHGNE